MLKEIAAGNPEGSQKFLAANGVDVPADPRKLYPVLHQYNKQTPTVEAMDNLLPLHPDYNIWGAHFSRRFKGQNLNIKKPVEKNAEGESPIAKSGEWMKTFDAKTVLLLFGILISGFIVVSIINKL